jgi:hypothetical protein
MSMVKLKNKDLLCLNKEHESLSFEKYDDEAKNNDIEENRMKKKRMKKKL